MFKSTPADPRIVSLSTFSYQILLLFFFSFFFQAASAVQQLLYLLPFLFSFIHLPAAVADMRQKSWRQAAIRVSLVVGMLLVILGTEGLISHYLWWSPLSDTDRYHMLHHTLIAGVPLTLAYGLAQRRWWQPANFVAAENLSLQSWLITGAILMLVFIALSGTVLGLGALVTGGAAAIFLILTILAIIVGRSRNH
jgi:hypothetical protein